MYASFIVATLTVRIAARRSPRKNEKRPAYVLQLTIARDTVDSLLDPSKRSVYLSVRFPANATTIGLTMNLRKRVSFKI